jgi:hypothetical protein
MIGGSHGSVTLSWPGTPEMWPAKPANHQITRFDVSFSQIEQFEGSFLIIDTTDERWRSLAPRTQSRTVTRQNQPVRLVNPYDSSALVPAITTKIAGTPKCLRCLRVHAARFITCQSIMSRVRRSSDG